MTDAEIGVIGTLAGTVVGFVLNEIARKIERSRSEAKHWAALRAEVERCASTAEGFVRDDVMAPLWRLPMQAYLAAVADGGMSTVDASALADFYSTADQLNRGLDDAAASERAGDGDALRNHHPRNVMKAKKITREGGSYKVANAALTRHLV